MLIGLFNLDLFRSYLGLFGFGFRSVMVFLSTLGLLGTEIFFFFNESVGDQASKLDTCRSLEGNYA
jgi:hypothetical protein